MIYYCPRCGAEVSAEAQVCEKCGLQRRDALRVSLLPATGNLDISLLASAEPARLAPNTPEIVPAILPIPTRSVQPNVKHVATPLQAKSYLMPPTHIDHQHQVQRPNPTAGQGQSHSSSSAATPLPQPPFSSLIRPVGARPLGNAATPAPQNIDPFDNTAPLQSTPAHLLALKPITPASSSSIRPPVQAQKTKAPQQFMRPLVMPTDGKTSNAQQKPLTPAPQQFIRPIIAPASTQQKPLTPAPQHNVQPMPTAQTGIPASQLLRPPLLSPGRSTPQGQVSLLVDLPTSQMPIEIVKGRPPLIEVGEHFTEEEEDNSESYVAASVAAEHWRTSWRNRQRSEAGPATLVSRGQSAVPEPLMAMQQSLMRMRAIVLPKKSRTNPAFWIALLLMLCIIGGLVTFIAATFQTPANTASPSIRQAATDLPSLSLEGPQAQQMATVVQGQTIYLHGENFDAGAPIIFALDGALAINGTNGRELAILASDQGSFAVTVLVAFDWSAGPHVISAHDNKNGQSAYLNIDVSLAGSGATSNPNLALSVKTVTLHVVVRQGNPPEQFITLRNTNATAVVQWTARAVADNQLTWLGVDDTTTGGNLSIGGTSTVGIYAIVGELTSTAKPYTGHIIFTINHREQLTLPVELQVSSGTPEIAINPNPLVGLLATTGDSCQGNAKHIAEGCTTYASELKLNRYHDGHFYPAGRL